MKDQLTRYETYFREAYENPEISTTRIEGKTDHDICYKLSD